MGGRQTIDSETFPSSEHGSWQLHVAEFWREVRERLLDEHDRNEADRGIGHYRLEAEKADAEEAIYNHGPEIAAKAIDAYLRARG